MDLSIDEANYNILVGECKLFIYYFDNLHNFDNSYTQLPDKYFY